ncbi:MAG: amidohydrolase family protein [Colwellia sp.]|nr:amidohydrolase family protein [Colwellia sp.]
MKKILQLLALYSLCFLTISCQQNAVPFLAEYPQIDLLIINGQVLDGLGNKAVAADLVIVEDEIVFIGKSEFTQSALAQRVKIVIDAKQRIVSPGFIDLHAHGSPLKTPAFENFLAMGITTITLGQDGDSPEVINLNNWLAKIEENGISVNLAMFVGHGTLRTLTGINRTVQPSAKDLQRMLELLDKTLKYTFGLSTGLEYNPGLHAQFDELNALAKVVGKNNRLIMSHLRNEDDDQLEASIQELLKQGHYAKVHVAHLKSVYGKGVDRAEKILKLLHDARSSGINVTADVYPYNASYAGVSLLFPVWAKTTEQFDIAKIERKEELETFLRNKIIKRNGPQATLLGTPPYTGRTLAELSQVLEIPFEQVLMKIGPKGAAGAYFIMDDALQSRLISDPLLAISSDGRLEGFHPRGHGAFAKIIEEYVNKRKVLSLPAAVQKMTSQSANILGISDRGILQAGKKADIIIFDPIKVKAKATYSQPHQFAQGFDVVIVNGKIARREGKIATEFWGTVLTP